MGRPIKTDCPLATFRTLRTALAVLIAPNTASKPASGVPFWRSG